MHFLAEVNVCLRDLNSGRKKLFRKDFPKAVDGVEGTLSLTPNKLQDVAFALKTLVLCLCVVFHLGRLKGSKYGFLHFFIVPSDSIYSTKVERERYVSPTFFFFFMINLPSLRRQFVTVLHASSPQKVLPDHGLLSQFPACSVS